MSVRSLAGALRRGAAGARAGIRGDGGATASRDATTGDVQRMIDRDQADFQNMRRLLGFCLQADANCIDVGAHRGAVLSEMRRVAPNGRHIAFEPLPHLAQLLRSEFPGVDVREAALSDHGGETSFAYVHGAAEGWSGILFRPLPTGEEATVEEITVKLERLDDLLDPDFRPAVIKVDVEGAELQVFKGAVETLRRSRPIVIFEHGSGSAEAYGTSPHDVFTFLADEAGMRIFDLDGSGPYSVERFEHTFFTAARVNFVAHG